MKKILFILLTLPFFAFSQSDKYKGLDDKYGFKDLKFETKESDFIKNKKFIKIPTKEVGLTKYNITDSKYLSVGDCNIAIIHVNFFNGLLMSFNIETKGAIYSHCLLSAFNTSFGEGYKSNEYIEKYAWLGYNATALYDENSLTGDATIWISSTKVMDDYLEFDKKRTKTNATDL